MEKIKCIVLDDDSFSCEVIASYVEETALLELAGKFTNPAMAMQFLMREEVPLIFCDMKMPEMTGIEFLRSLPYQPYAIILSSYPDFALEGYEVNAVDYIVKPVTEERFFAAANKAVKRIELSRKAADVDTLKNMLKTGEGFFFIHTKQQYIKVFYKDVLYVEALENFVKIYLCQKPEPVFGLVSLKLIETSLPSDIFLRVHKSFIINMNHITAVDADTIKLANKLVPVGRAYREAALEKVVKKNLIRH